MLKGPQRRHARGPRLEAAAVEERSEFFPYRRVLEIAHDCRVSGNAPEFGGCTCADSSIDATFQRIHRDESNAPGPGTDVAVPAARCTTLTTGRSAGHPAQVTAIPGSHLSRSSSGTVNGCGQFSSSCASSLTARATF